MKSLADLIRVFILLSFLVPPLGAQQDRPRTSREDSIQKQIEHIVQAQSSWETAKLYEQLFNNVRGEDRRLLTLDSHYSIAVRAAWEEIRQTIPERQQIPAAKIDSLLLARFLGFLEGRCCLAAPKSWQDAMPQLQAHRRDNIYSPPPLETPYHRTGGFLAPKNVRVEKRGENFVLRDGEESMTLPASILKEKQKLPGPSLAAHFTPQKCFLAVHGDRGFAYSLLCIERKSGKTIWKTDIWANGHMRYNGIGHHYVSVTSSNDRVIVFGRADDGLYVEVFSEKDGKNLMRFSTSY
jgi:hypothetical protein